MTPSDGLWRMHTNFFQSLRHAQNEICIWKGLKMWLVCNILYFLRMMKVVAYASFFVNFRGMFGLNCVWHWERHCVCFCAIQAIVLEKKRVKDVMSNQEEWWRFIHYRTRERTSLPQKHGLVEAMCALKHGRTCCEKKIVAVSNVFRKDACKTISEWLQLALSSAVCFLLNPNFAIRLRLWHLGLLPANLEFGGWAVPFSCHFLADFLQVSGLPRPCPAERTQGHAHMRRIGMKEENFSSFSFVLIIGQAT